MRAAKRDQNEKDVVLALRKCGATVERLYSTHAGCPDLAVGMDGRNFLVEVKVPKTGRLSDAQVAWRESWRGSKPFVITSTVDVVSFIQLVKGNRKPDAIHKQVQSP